MLRPAGFEIRGSGLPPGAHGQHQIQNRTGFIGLRVFFGSASSLTKCCEVRIATLARLLH
jgi:hypothetical protein